MENTITIEEFKKADLRVGKILEAEDHPKADKLYVLKVSFGQEIGERTIVAGLKKHYTKEQLKGKHGIFIVNLEPAVLRGIKSEGMTLAAVSDDESVIAILQPEKDIEPGSKIR